MVQLSIDTDAGKVAASFDSIAKKMPEFAERQAKKIAQFFATEFKRSIRRNDLVWRGSMLRAVKVVKRGSSYAAQIDTLKRGGVDYAAWHEFANSGHWVATYKPKNYPIADWAQQVFSDVPPYIFVTPTPFAKTAVRRAVTKTQRFLADGGDLNEFLNRELEGAGAPQPIST